MAGHDYKREYEVICDEADTLLRQLDDLTAYLRQKQAGDSKLRNLLDDVEHQARILRAEL